METLLYAPIINAIIWLEFWDEQLGYFENLLG
jgi:hypothetical protein